MPGEDASPGAALARLSDPDYWRRLAPHLTVTAEAEAGRALSGVAGITLVDGLLGEVSDSLAEDGYFTLPPLMPPAEVAALRDGIERVTAAGWPAAFIHVYDETWRFYARLAPLLSHFLGDAYRQIPNLWAWSIPTRDDASGWPPHRDYQGESAFDNGLLVSLSVWIPLTPATADNGCMRVLPLSRERRYDRAPASLEEVAPADIVTLEAAPGAVMGWRQDVLHWGGRSSATARHPRVSLSGEFQNPAFAPLAEPLIDPASPPSFDRRVAQLARAVCGYGHMERLDRGLVAQCRRLAG